MDLTKFIPSIIEAIVSLFQIAKAAGLSEEDMSKIRLKVIKEIDRIADQQIKDEVEENAIVRGEG